MDGTLIDSTAGVVGAWATFKDAYPHIDVKDILNSMDFCASYSSASGLIMTVQPLMEYGRSTIFEIIVI